MKCKECGAEIASDQLLCPKCGWEVQMVPEFESVVDIVVQDAMENIAGHVIRTQEEEEEAIRTEISEKQNYLMHIHSTIITLVLVLIIGVLFFIKIYNAPPGDPLETAQSAQAQGDYDKATEYYEEYVKQNPDDMESLLILGDCYRRTGRYGDAIAVYSRFSPEETDENSKNAAKALADIYIETEDFHSASDILLKPACDSFRDKYSEYVAYVPEFSVAQDTYDQPVYVRILYKGQGDVFYTMDGTDPDPTSMLYENPILLEKGVYTIKAVAVNPHGVMSQTATSIYEIQSVGNISISPESGTITEPDYITVDVPIGCIIYYTTDMSVPTKESTVYNGPIPIPVGESTFRFLVVLSNGQEEELVREYYFEYYAAISEDDALNILIDGLMRRGLISNALGQINGLQGHNLYGHSSIITINSNTYYLIDEYYQDPLSQPVKTGNIFCVDTESGALYRAMVDNDGHYSVVSI